MTVVLGLVNTLFAAFVLVQVGYFFGGSSQISVTGLTYSEYARKGIGRGRSVVVTTYSGGVLFVADTKAASIVALATADTQAASAKDLKVEGINKTVAEKIYHFFHDGNA